MDIQELVYGGGVVPVGQNFDADVNDGIQAWVSDLASNDIVDESEYILFPQLDQPQLSKDLFEDFVDIDALDVCDTATLQECNNQADGAIMADKIDFSDLYQLGSPEISDEAAIASKLLSEDDDEITNLLISYIDNDGEVSSPEMSNETVDVLLDGLTDPLAGFNDNKNQADTDTKTDLLTEILAKTEPLVANEQIIDTSTVNCDIYFPEDTSIDEKVVNEFADLLNSINDSLTNWDAIQTTSSGNNNASSVDYVNSLISANLCNIEDSVFPFANVNNSSEQTLASIDDSVNSHLNNNCSGENIQNTETTETKKAARKKIKRKYSSVSSSVSSVGDDDKVSLRRHKNNEASKVTRAKRRCRHKDLFEQERKLIESNAELRIKAEVMQKEADILRELLVVALSNAKC